MLPKRCSLLAVSYVPVPFLMTVASCPCTVALEKIQIGFSGAGLFERRTIETPEIFYNCKFESVTRIKLSPSYLSCDETASPRLVIVCGDTLFSSTRS